MPSSLKGPILPSEAEARMAAGLAGKIAARLGEGATLKLQVEGKKGEALTAFLDANALYPAELRNLLMRLALAEAHRPLWSDRVQKEWTEALGVRPRGAAEPRVPVWVDQGALLRICAHQSPGPRTV